MLAPFDKSQLLLIESFAEQAYNHAETPKCSADDMHFVPKDQPLDYSSSECLSDILHVDTQEL